MSDSNKKIGHAIHRLIWAMRAPESFKPVVRFVLKRFIYSVYILDRLIKIRNTRDIKD